MSWASRVDSEENDHIQSLVRYDWSADDHVDDANYGGMSNYYVSRL